MRKIILFSFFCFAVSVISSFGESRSGERTDSRPLHEISVSTVTKTGAWCWFADPRALTYANKAGTIHRTYIGYIDTQGNIKATQIDHRTNKADEVLIRSYFQPDDHDNPTFLVLPDERVMIFYSRHNDEPCFYYRISQKPGDITTLGREVRLATAQNTTYPSPFILSDDPDHIYLCWRGIGWHPTIARLTLPDQNDRTEFDWGPYQIVRSKKGAGGVRPYAKYVSNGKDKIYMAYTTTHPDNQSVNYVYLNSIDINSHELKDIKGNRLETIGSGTLHDVDATETYKNSYPYAVAEDSPYRNWIWEVAIDQEEHPVIAMARISEDKEAHSYYHVEWTGTTWRKTFLDNAGGHFHQTPDIEKCYSGGIAIDKENHRIFYASVPVEGKYGKVYELKKYTLDADGKLVSTEQLTFDSPKNNVRPFVISGKDGKPLLSWMYGDYYDWVVSPLRPGYLTGIKANFPIPAGEIHLEKGLLKRETPGRVSQDTIKTYRVAGSKAFTVALSLSIDHDFYYGILLKIGTLKYGVDPGELPKPYIKVGNKTYSSSNVFGTSDSWKSERRGTSGLWYIPEKFNTFRLALSYENGILRTYVNGLIDQSVDVADLSLGEIDLGGFKGMVKGLRIYNRALSQDEIKSLDFQK
ncbi:BNR-4 repeat-containing protein [Parabacteroides sp. Marseille-P3160]|uniref:BNR-4 repeat-containing protein n=1 Tax=Parabacteroides sp. Marseille-P3160 TaxID=1917887 RepID=UPI001F3A5DD6|nr:BNR-4 repeat-containing protein [Parabacteroides sp. Marseille-P3160]